MVCVFHRIVLVIAFLPSFVFADSSGPNSTGTGADDASVGSLTWTNPGNITSSDDTYATVTIGAAQITHYLMGTNYSFSLPADATINGILMEVERKCVGAVGQTIDSSIRIVKGGTISGDEKSAGASWVLGTDTYASFGGASDLWGLTWTYSDINASDFGAVVSATITGISSAASVDHMRITVYYTSGGTPSIQSRDWFPEDDF